MSIYNAFFFFKLGGTFHNRNNQTDETEKSFTDWVLTIDYQ